MKDSEKYYKVRQGYWKVFKLNVNLGLLNPRLPYSLVIARLSQKQKPFKTIQCETPYVIKMKSNIQNYGTFNIRRIK